MLPDAMSEQELTVEGSGETVGEAKWVALRELEKRAPGLDKASVRFQVLSEGERGLLGVGYTPARVLASVDPSAVRPEPPARGDESSDAARARAIVERIAAALGISCAIDLDETDEEIHVECGGADLGVLIGRHGQTIDAIQYLVNAIVYKDRYGEERKQVVVDAAGYRDRRKETLHAVAVRAAEQATSTGGRVALEPMTAIERKVVHERLKEYPGVETSSEGTEPNRYVVVLPPP